MINLQIDIQMFSEFIPEVFLTLLILLPPKISPLSTQVQPGKVWKLLIQDVLKEHQDQVLCFGVSHVIHSDAELGHEDVVLGGRSAQEQDRLVALLNVLVDGVEVAYMPSVRSSSPNAILSKFGCLLSNPGLRMFVAHSLSPSRNIILIS